MENWPTWLNFAVFLFLPVAVIAGLLFYALRRTNEEEEPVNPHMEDGVIINELEAVGGPCGMTNAQAALIAAAAAGYKDEEVTEVAEVYKVWLDRQDKKH